MIQIYPMKEFRNHPAAIAYFESVTAGFPSPADDHMDKALDLNEHLIAHPASTFFVRVQGDSMTGAGIHHGDLLIVDKSLHAQTGDIVIAFIEGEFTVKRYICKGNRHYLYPENSGYPVIEVSFINDFRIWGVVCYSVHATGKKSTQKRNQSNL